MKQRDPIDVLDKLITTMGTQKAVAEYFGVSAPFVGDLLKGMRPFPERILLKMGLCRVIVEK